MKSDLDWYYNCFTCQSGINYENYSKEGDVDLRPYYGQCTYNEIPHLNTSVYKDCRKYRKIQRKLQFFSPTQRRMLSSLFDQQYIKSYKYLSTNGKVITVIRSVFPEQLTNLFGTLTGLVFFSTNVKSLDELLKLVKSKHESMDIKNNIQIMYDDLEKGWNALHNK